MLAVGAPNYPVLRTLTYGIALELFPNTLQTYGLGHLCGLPIHFREIDDAAIEQWTTYWDPISSRQGGFEWGRIAIDYRNNIHSRFEVAIWCGPVLCGLAVGRVRDVFVEVRMMEGCPASQPLRGAIRYAVVEVGRAYARALGKAELRLNRPKPALLTIYQQMGFTLVPPHNDYCWMRV